MYHLVVSCILYIYFETLIERFSNTSNTFIINGQSIKKEEIASKYTEKKYLGPDDSLHDSRLILSD